jgi:serine/threonine protein phosphatase PrpC
MYNISVYTDKGGKKVNEDSVRHIVNGNNVTAVVADGLGSHGGGDVASSVCADLFVKELPNCFDNEKATTVFEKANNLVVANQKPGLEMKSTAVTLNILNGNAVYAHIGDSRGYIFRNGRVIVQTQDHSLPQLEVLRGNLKPSEIRFHPGRNRVLRALGTDVAKPDFTKPEPVMIGDAYLMCTDGFWEYVTEEEMGIDLQKSLDAKAWIHYMLVRLTKRVPFDHDNLTAFAMIVS